MKRFIRSKKGIVLLATLVVAAVAAASGFAYFTGAGHGTLNTSVGNSTGWTVAITADSGNAALYPGQGTNSFTYQVNNSGGGNELLSTVTVQIANNDGSPWTYCSGEGNNPGDTSGGNCTTGNFPGEPVCTNLDFSVNGGSAGATATFTYGNHYAPGAGPSHAFTVKMVDASTNQNNCQGAHPPILVTAS